MDHQKRVSRPHRRPCGGKVLNPLPPDGHDGGDEGGTARTDAGSRELNEGLASEDLIPIAYEGRQAVPPEGNRVQSKVQEDGPRGALYGYTVAAREDLRHAPITWGKGGHVSYLFRVECDPSPHDPLREDGVGKVGEGHDSPSERGQNRDGGGHSALHLAAHLRLNVVRERAHHHLDPFAELHDSYRTRLL